MELELGRPYQLPRGEDPSWFREALREVRRVRVGDVRIRLHLRDGVMVSGTLEAAEEAVTHDGHGVIYLGPPTPRDQLRAFACEEIAAFTLHGEPPIDQSDELRGS